MALLETVDLSIHFGGVFAVDRVSMSCEPGEIVGIIGPNGAGKTTLFNLLSGIYHATHGSILFHDKDITRFKPHSITALGIARTFQSSFLFNNMTVFDNVLIGQHCRTQPTLWGSILGHGKAKKRAESAKLKARECLEFVGLADKSELLAENLPFGDQRRLEVARALATSPRLLLLDEPASGMNPAEKYELTKLIHKIHMTGISIFIVAHDMELIMTLSDRVIVLNYGKKIAEGTPHEIQTHVKVREAYLGTECRS